MQWSSKGQSANSLFDKLASKQKVLDHIIYLLNILAHQKYQIKIPQCNINHILTNLSNRGRISKQNSEFLSASCTLPIGRHFEFHPAKRDVTLALMTQPIFCVGFPHTLSGAAIFLSLFICIREPSVVTWSLAVRERTLGMRKLYAFRQKNYHRFVSPLSFCFILVKCSWLV